MLAQTVITTPDTMSYLLLALTAFFGILVLYVGSIALRTRNLHKDEALVEQLSEDNK